MLYTELPYGDNYITDLCWILFTMLLDHIIAWIVFCLRMNDNKHDVEVDLTLVEHLHHCSYLFIHLRLFYRYILFISILFIYCFYSMIYLVSIVLTLLPVFFIWFENLFFGLFYLFHLHLFIFFVYLPLVFAHLNFMRFTTAFPHFSVVDSWMDGGGGGAWFLLLLSCKPRCVTLFVWKEQQK